MSQNRERNLRILDRGILISVAVTCGIMLALGLIGVKKISTWTIDYAYISAVLLCAIATHFILAIYGSFGLTEIDEKINESTKKIIDSLDGIEKTTFDSIKAVDAYVAKRIRNAKFCVLDLNWQDYRPSQRSHSQQNRQETDDDIDDSIKSFCNRNKGKRHCSYEEIFTFPESNKTNLRKMKRHLQFGDIYSCCYYETKDKEHKFPKIQFVIIDKEEVIFVSSEYQGNFCAIKDKRIVEICCNYFTQATDLSTIVKERFKDADSTLVANIEANYHL